MMVTTPAQKTKRPGPNRKKSGKGHATRLHGVNRPTNGAPSSGKRTSDTLFNIAPWKIIVSILVAGALGVGYLSHVFATQQLARDVRTLEQQYEQVRRHHDELRLQYDRMVGPAEIYERAKEAGFVNGGPAEKIITVED